MSIVSRKTKDGKTRYYARKHVGAGKYVTGKTRATREEAEVDYAKLVLQPKRPGEKTVAELVAWLLLTYPERPRPRTREKPRDSTVASLTSALTPFNDAFGSYRPADIPREELKSWLARYGWAAAWVKVMLNEAVDSELIERNPLTGITVPRSRGRRDIEVLTVEEVHDLAACAIPEHGEKYGPVVSALVYWLAFTCMRPAETYVVEWGDVEGDEIVVRRSLGRTGIVTTPKNHRTRRIILPDLARDAIGAMPRRLDTDLIFTAKRGQRLNEGKLHHYWNPVRARFVGGLSEKRRAELEPTPKQRVSPYVLRHTGATWLLELGVSHADVALQLGHTDGGALVLSTYGHPSQEHGRERLRRAINPQPVAELRRTTARRG